MSTNNTSSSPNHPPPPAGANHDVHDLVAAANWSGAIPVRLTLAPTSLSSPTLPPPLHVLVARQTYLHTGLQAAVQRLHPFAPVATLGGHGDGMFHVSEPDPGGGSREEEEEDDNGNSKDGDALKRNDESGAVPADDNSKSEDEARTNHHHHPKQQPHKPFVSSYPVCWFEDEDTQLAVRWHLFAGVLFDLKPSPKLPWRLQLHFTNYPATQILPLENSVLQTLQSTFKHSLKQALTLQQGSSKGAMNVTKESHGLLWEAVTTAKVQIYRRVFSKTATAMPVSIPIRMLVNGIHPPIQRRVDGTTALTLADLLRQWIPSSDDMICRVCGVEPPRSTPLVELWRHCAHPDQFLYIVVLTTTR